jgi:hypothetical protein
MFSYVDRSGVFGTMGPHRVAAHLAFDTTWTGAVAAGYNSFLQYLIQYSLMKHHPLPWGE